MAAQKSTSPSACSIGLPISRTMISAELLALLAVQLADAADQRRALRHGRRSSTTCGVLSSARPIASFSSASLIVGYS